MDTDNQTYLANKKAFEDGLAAYRSINEEFETGDEINKQLLFKILDDNKNTEYGKKYGFAEITSVEDYQKKVPVITYDDIVEQVMRMADGEKDILTAYPFDHMNETSGTVKAPKLVPMTQPQTAVYLKYNKQYGEGLQAEFLGEKWLNGRAFTVSEGTCRTLESGITVGSASAKMADYISGGKQALGQMMNVSYTSPIEAVIPDPGTDTKYLHTRFALADGKITGIISAFFCLIVNYLKYIASNYEMLIDDIEHGTVNKDIHLSDEARASIEKRLVPMPERAAELREIFKDGSDYCFVPKIWPELQYISGVGSDGFSVYDDMLKNRFIGPDAGVRRIFSGVIASEGLWSVPAGLDTADSVMAPNSAFFEFHPVDAEDDYTKCVAMDQVKEGEIYEIIVTNLCGYYRYRTGDAVKVTGFRGHTPLIQFMYRVNKSVNMAAEKTTEKQLQEAVEKAMKELGLELSDFAMYPDYDKMQYVFLVEPTKEDTGVSRERLAETISKHLRELNTTFGMAIDVERLIEPDAFWLQPETAMLYRDLQVAKGASPSQIKPVRVITKEEQKKFFFGLRMM
ncbi:MAG: GH3 auxin-responsive promoter family protein [Dehalococcoidales bacterium]|nr:GH3 auxin-responsive promoter family protein [Dehalococcoidales bacterium]